MEAEFLAPRGSQFGKLLSGAELELTSLISTRLAPFAAMLTGCRASDGFFLHFLCVCWLEW